MRTLIDIFDRVTKNEKVYRELIENFREITNI